MAALLKTWTCFVRVSLCVYPYTYPKLFLRRTDVKLYELQQLSQERAAELADMTRTEFFHQSQKL
ncbi:MAG: UPF0175 family protein [Leptospiraceae bacterium]|nr:UPF0175 family protein [Leptospiraceae bacterium]MCP5496196.1 UPF0175 family protein [Leptospiraceae bacterium]